MTRFEYFKSMDVYDLIKYIIDESPFPSCKMCSYNLVKPPICYEYVTDKGYPEFKARPFVKTLCWEGIKNYLESEVESD